MTEQGCVSTCIWLCCSAPTTGENGSSGRLTALPKIPGQSKVPAWLLLPNQGRQLPQPRNSPGLGTSREGMVVWMGQKSEGGRRWEPWVHEVRWERVPRGRRRRLAGQGLEGKRSQSRR